MEDLDLLLNLIPKFCRHTCTSFNSLGYRSCQCKNGVGLIPFGDIYQVGRRKQEKNMHPRPKDLS
jgi:hypothetical protein